ncbi:MAG: hypothetical protein SVX43_18875 [Cyanobacteriota bacterium]|nr:hypothetical protein [Cyanobacteriota bacterium]
MPNEAVRYVFDGPTNNQQYISDLKNDISSINNKLDQLLFRTPPIPCC